MTTFKQEHSINALEIRLQLQYDDFNAYESKAQGYINMSAVLIAVLGLLHFSEGTIKAPERVFILAFLTAVGWVFYFSFLTIRKSKWKAPIKTSKEGLKEFQSFVQTSIDEAYMERMFDTYTECLSENRGSLITKRKNLTKAEFGIYAESAFILVLVIFSIWR